MTEHSFLKINDGRGLVRSLLSSPIPIDNRVELVFRLITPMVALKPSYEMDIKRLMYFCEKLKENKAKNYHLYDTEEQIYKIYPYYIFYPIIKGESRGTN